MREALAYCKQKVFGGGWQVIQQRMLQLPYSRPLMADYVRGFGRPDGDYWIGLDAMATITAIPHELLIIIRDKFGRELAAHYAFIRINQAELGYAIQLGEKMSGELPDEWSRLNSKSFSAYDHERPVSCKDTSGWWHSRDCYAVNLNIQMGSGTPRVRYSNIEGYPDEFEVAEASMLIRPIRA